MVAAAAGGVGGGESSLVGGTGESSPGRRTHHTGSVRIPLDSPHRSQIETNKLTFVTEVLKAIHLHKAYARGRVMGSARLDR